MNASDTSGMPTNCTRIEANFGGHLTWAWSPQMVSNSKDLGQIQTNTESCTLRWRLYTINSILLVFIYEPITPMGWSADLPTPRFTLSLWLATNLNQWVSPRVQISGNSMHTWLSPWTAIGADELEFNTKHAFGVLCLLQNWLAGSWKWSKRWKNMEKQHQPQKRNYDGWDFNWFIWIPDLKI